MNKLKNPNRTKNISTILFVVAAVFFVLGAAGFLGSLNTADRSDSYHILITSTFFQLLTFLFVGIGFAFHRRFKKIQRNNQKIEEQ